MPVTHLEFLRAAQTLGLSPRDELTIDAIQRQYKQMMKNWHPDLNAEFRAEADQYSQKINQAREVLLAWLEQQGGRSGGTANQQRDESPKDEPPRQSSNKDAPKGSSPKAHSVRRNPIREAIFAFYWRFGFFPHWRILLIPVAYVIATYIFRGGELPKFNQSSVAPSGLLRETIDPLYWGAMAGHCVTDNSPACDRVLAIVASGEYKTLSCRYGPSSGGQGAGFSNYMFWQNKVPADPAGYAIAGSEHPFLLLGTKAVASCPPDVETAEALFRSARLSAP